MKISKTCTNVILSLLCLITLFSMVKSEYDFYDDVVNNPYRELRLPPWSTMSQIKQRYKELVKIYHPDKTKNRNAHDKFLAIQQAYERIKNRRKGADKEEASDDYDDQESEEINSFFDALSDVLKIIIAIGISLSFIHFVSWLCYRFYALVYTPFFSLVSSFVICDRLFPHYFKNLENQILYSTIFGIMIYFSKKILSSLFSRLWGTKDLQSTDKKKN
jgi:curved DNA-binding protein CbpA